MPDASFPDLPALAQHLRDELDIKKKFVLLYAYNGTGKTRLSTAFKNLGKTVNADGEVTGRDTLYFNAFTEDLFSWDNDLKNDRERVLRINGQSRFLDGLRELEMDNRVRPLLGRYADFDFRIDPEEWEVSFSREVREPQPDGTYATRREEDVKVSRGEENIFVWCFFLAVVRLVLDGAEAYRWVRYIYIDDPISSLDENNAVMVANHLAKMLGEASQDVGTVVSTHHVLFFNVLCNELRKSHKYFLRRTSDPAGFAVYDTTSKPFLSHLAALVELHEAERTGHLYTHHFNAMRRVMEQTAGFLGYQRWDECIRPEPADPNPTIYKRVIDLMSHGDYSLYEPREMMPENKEHFGRVLRQFVATHPFSPALFAGSAS